MSGHTVLLISTHVTYLGEVAVIYHRFSVGDRKNCFEFVCIFNQCSEKKSCLGL